MRIMYERRFLWGAGGIGTRALKYLAPLRIFSGIIDSDTAKQGQLICGLEVFGYETQRPQLKEAEVVIAHLDFKETESLLDRDDIKHYRLQDFITVWFWESRQQNAIGFLDFPITTRCSLNCKACMQYIPYREKRDMPLEKMKRDLDALFQHIAFVGEMSLIGGEPFLYEQLAELLEYIGGNYRERIGSLVVTTNGTILPEKRVLELCKDLEVFISISDYSKTLPQLDVGVERLLLVAWEAGVGIERKRWSWTDPGRFDAESNSEGCTMTHMQLRDGKLWCCTLMAAGCGAGFCDAVEGHDYFDLLEGKENAREFLSADVSRMKTTQCGSCLSPKGIAIPSAVQI